MRFGSFIALASLSVPALGRHYIISNLCPSAINVFVAGSFLQTIESNFETSVNLSDDETYFYTDANRKSDSSNGTRVGFKLEKPFGYYYMIVDPNNFNVGVAIEAFSDNPDESCDTVFCSSTLCTEAFNNNQAPTDSELNTLPTSSAHISQLHSCLFDDMTYTITYCPGPDETFPSDTHVLHPSGNDGNLFCLDVQGAKFENGTPVQLFTCNGTPAQQWVLNAFSTKVKLAGTNFCLDAGSNPGNGVGMKIWECFDDLPAQSWFYTEDNRLALEGQGLCLDLANGTKGNGSFVQTWQCTDNDTNQIWTDFFALSG